MRFFDITRLSKRAEAQGPSGIDRVDLAYLQWLRELGPVEYLVHGIAGFTQIERSLGDDFADKLKSKWQGNALGFDQDELLPFQDTAHRYRSAGKWWARRVGLEKLLMAEGLQDLCKNKVETLDLLDGSADKWAYRLDPKWKKWRRNHINGCFFGISHSMLSRTAYLSALTRQVNLKRVFFIHDTIPCDYPEYCRADEGARHLLRLRNTFRYATHVIVNSEYTKQRLEHWRLLLGGRKLPVEVIPIGVDEGLLNHKYIPSPAPESKRPYFVVLGTIEPRKNHAMLLEVWRHFTETLPADEIPELRIIGKRGWENESVFQILDHCESLRGHVQEMNDVKDDELWPLLHSARAMLFPSFVEGWGMPMVEALTLGVPVISSDIPAFREAGQGVPELISPSNNQLWAERIREFAKKDSVGRLEQRTRLNNYNPPTWQEHFTKVEAMLENDSLKLHA